MEVPSALIGDIKSGRVVLFLGAGASKEAVSTEGKAPPGGRELGDLLLTKFLGGKAEYSNQSLSFISELAISETDLLTVQNFIAENLKNFSPSDSHRALSDFNWRGIFTTNFDDILEKAYEEKKVSAVQKLVPFISNFDRVDDAFRSKDNLPYIKLHGCVTRLTDSNVRLILTPEQYVTHRQSRDRLFNLLKEWGHEYPIIFIGHGLQDPDLVANLLELDQLGEARPRYYLVSRSVSEEESRLWESKRISVMKGSFSEFVSAIESLIPRELRFSGHDNSDHPIVNRSSGDKRKELSAACREFLENDVEYVHANLPIEKASGEAFYRGFDLGWYPIEKKLDVRRELVDTIIFDRILTNEEERPTKAELYVVKAEAGSGKTILLRRIAWDSAIEANSLCLYARQHGRLSIEPIEELCRLFESRIFLFIDNLADRVAEVEDLMIKARRLKLALTIVSSERLNEWNMECGRLESYVSGTYQLPYLDTSEIERLLVLLEKNNSLGYLLELSQAARLQELEKRAGRQLLVALHEATQGRPFEEIIFDEYSEIRPLLAQSIYLTVCTLNRLNIPVRAGLVSRIYGIPFSEFREKLFSPLEHVVHISEDTIAGDYLYSARHSEIAQIVFSSVLKKAEDRFNEYSRILANLNLSYDSDLEAFRKLTKGRALLEMFPDHTAVLEIFKIATEINPGDTYLLHQQGIYEMNRPNGNFEKAYKILSDAKNINPRDLSIIHSLAELARLQAEKAKTNIEKERYRKESEKLLDSLMGDKNSRRYARHTLIKIYLDRLGEELSSVSPVDREIDELVQKIEANLERGLQEFPEEAHLLFVESKFHAILNEKEQALQALLRAFNANKRNPYIAGSLARSYQLQKDIPKAIGIITAALEANPGEKRLHYQLAMLLKSQRTTGTETMLYHLKRSFTPDDQNYDAQFWYAYYCFLVGTKERILESKELFKKLREAPISYDARIKIRTRLEIDGVEKVFVGKIMRKDQSFGFVRREGLGDDIFIHMSHSDPEVWDKVRWGDRVRFSIGFNFGGPTACNIKSA